MELLPSYAVDLFDLVAHHPAQQVNAVDTLVHQAAAVLRPGAPPGRLGIVVPVPVPANMDGAMGNLSEATRFQRPAGFLHRNVETILMAGGNLHALFFTAADDLLRVIHGHSHGLLNDNVDAMIDAVQRDFGVKAGLGGNTDKGNIIFRQHLLVVGVTSDGSVLFQTVLGEQRLHGLGLYVADGDNVQIVVNGGFDVIRGNSATADQRVIHCRFSSLSL